MPFVGHLLCFSKGPKLPNIITKDNPALPTNQFSSKSKQTNKQTNPFFNITKNYYYLKNKKLIFETFLKLMLMIEPWTVMLFHWIENFNLPIFFWGGPYLNLTQSVWAKAIDKKELAFSLDENFPTVDIVQGGPAQHSVLWKKILHLISCYFFPPYGHIVNKIFIRWVSQSLDTQTISNMHIGHFPFSLLFHTINKADPCPIFLMIGSHHKCHQHRYDLRPINKWFWCSKLPKVRSLRVC